MNHCLAAQNHLKAFLVHIFRNYYFCLARGTLPQTDYCSFNSKVRVTSVHGVSNTLPRPCFPTPSEQLARHMGMGAWHEE